MGKMVKLSYEILAYIYGYILHLLFICYCHSQLVGLLAR